MCRRDNGTEILQTKNFLKKLMAKAYIVWKLLACLQPPADCSNQINQSNKYCRYPQLEMFSHV